jgi:hypothetical protein
MVKQSASYGTMGSERRGSDKMEWSSCRQQPSLESSKANEEGKNTVRNTDVWSRGTDEFIQ